MKFYIVIPAHNEADSIALTIESLIAQTITPTKLVIVNDHSTDATGDIVSSYMQNHPWISLINVKSEDKHLPGSKIINAFYKGLNALDEDYDIICKFDADLIFPANYLETIADHFNANPKLGMAAGFCYIKQNDNWVLEGLTNKDHIRGALKSYRKQCFSDIGQLKPAMGWDTIDELLAKFYHWDILTDESLHVKHLKPTGASYNKSSKYMQGEAMYRMRYGFTITAISALKLALKKKNISLFKDYMTGYFKARTNKTEALVTKEQGIFIRKLRWQGMLQKFKA
ncbi:glycosyltransferase family 2 protein [Formosa sp. S-31]|uniref:glycosyltransferase family 2 protein n=1 Tax=Formosa sp. S-31 TaxID=2790949 RepID=UPI003EB78B75